MDWVGPAHARVALRRTDRVGTTRSYISMSNSKYKSDKEKMSDRKGNSMSFKKIVLCEILFICYFLFFFKIHRFLLFIGKPTKNEGFLFSLSLVRWLGFVEDLFLGPELAPLLVGRQTLSL